MTDSKEMLRGEDLQAKVKTETAFPQTNDEPIFGKIERVAMAYSEIDTDDLIAALTAFTEDEGK